MSEETLPGEMIGDRDPWPAWVYTDSTLVQVGQWMRRVHDATATFVPPEDECWFTGRTMQPGMIVGHQDVAPYMSRTAPAACTCSSLGQQLTEPEQRRP
jgi:hypothetical protein